jgi:primosomal protein N''
MKDIKNVIYIGNKESITAVFNRNLFQRKDDIVVEYLLKANDRLEKIIVY